MSERIVIVGCRGRMGSMLMERFGRNPELAPAGLDLPFEEQAVQEACRGARLVLLCIPATAIADTVACFAPSWRKAPSLPTSPR